MIRFAYARFFALTLSGLLSGCYFAFDPDRFDYDGPDAAPGVDGGVEDAAAPDGGGDSGTAVCVDGNERPCEGGSSIGECSPGTQVCVSGAWAACSGAVGPMDEVCDGRDNNCDNIEDGIEATLACGSGQACIGGECVITMCPDFMLDCDGDSSNGCEADSRTDREHCGECGNECAWSCASALCTDPLGLSGGRFHSCSRGATGVFCWGNNLDGQLGVGSRDRQVVPTPVMGFSDAEDVAAGSNHTCAIRLGAVYCWGANTQRQLGVEGASRRLVPMPTSITDATSVAAGTGFTCITRSTAQAFCWGANGEGQAGVGSTGTSTHVARPVMGLLAVTSLSAGGSHACAIASGTLRCWGRNREGQVGDGSSLAIRDAPQRVSGVDVPAEVSAGRLFTCVRTMAGEVFCWGDNSHGQLGLGTVGGQESSPRQVAGLSGVDQISAGEEHVCARVADRVFCWGSNEEGQLAQSVDMASSSSPLPVSGLVGVVDLAVGGEHTCVRLDAGGVQCWGRGLDGQLGNGATDRRASPVDVIAP